jgi:uncharacterized protein YbjT (DUF2867 family)
MSSDKIILVTGATGLQGGSVARHLQRDGRFKVRALTRDGSSARAEGLQKLGVEVIEGDLADRASLKSALDGAYGVFGVTNYWEHFDKEIEHGKNLTDAAAESEIQHFVCSTLPSPREITGGELSVPHLETKAEIERYVKKRGLPATFVHVAFYYENFFSYFPPRKQEDGSYAFGFPQSDTPLTAVCVEDLGGVVAAVFNDRDRFLGRTVTVAGDVLPPQEYAAAMTGVLGKQVRYNYIPREVFASFGFPGAEDLADMFEYNRRFVPPQDAAVKECRALYRELQSFGQWAGKNREALASALG